jgi:arylformamidase
MIIYDISRELFSAPVYPGDPAPQIQKIKGFEFGDIYNLSALYACTHTGTHIDAPLHFFDDGGDVASIPLEKCMGNAAVITLPAGPITGEVVERYFPRYISKVILRTQPDNVFFGGAA